MRIALLAHTNAPWTPHYARFFSAEGHAVCVASLHPQKIDGVETRCFGNIPSRDSGGKSLILTRVPAIRRFLRSWSPDVLFAPYLISNGLTAALARVAPLVVSARGGDVLAQSGGTPMPALVRKAIVRFVCSRSRLVHAVSDELVDAMVAMGVARRKIECFPVGVDLQRFPPCRITNAENDEPLLICTRRHEPVYRNGDIVEALASLKSRDRRVRCLFVGGGPLLGERRQQASSLGVDDRIEFAEQVAHDQVPALLGQATIYISASSSDGTSSSLLEAMACGVFPVVSRIRANQDWLRDGETGLLYETGNPVDMARALERALDDSRLRKDAAEANRRTVERHADLASNNRRLLAMLRSAATGTAHQHSGQARGI